MANPRTRDTVANEAATPIWISRRTLRVLIAAGVAALVLLLWHAPALVVLSIGGGALALVLSFPVRTFSRWMPRGAAIALTMVLAAALVAVVITVVVPIILHQLGALVAAVPRIAQRLGDRVPSTLDWLAARGLSPDSPEKVLQELQQRLLVAVQEFMGRLLGGLGRFVSGVAGVVAAFLGMMLVAVYILSDARRIRAGLLRASPHRYRRDVRALWDALGKSLSRYLGGLVLTCTIEGVLAAIALHFLGVPYAFLLGAWVSVTAIIPYVGAWIGYVPAVLLALSISPTRALVALSLFLVFNTFMGNVVAPRIQGRAVRVDPSIVFLATVAGAELFGLAGVILAVPSVALLRVLFDFFRVRVRLEESRAAQVPAVEPRYDGSLSVAVLPTGSANASRGAGRNRTGE